MLTTIIVFFFFLIQSQFIWFWYLIAFSSAQLLLLEGLLGLYEVLNIKPGQDKHPTQLTISPASKLQFLSIYLFIVTFVRKLKDGYNIILFHKERISLIRNMETETWQHLMPW